MNALFPEAAARAGLGGVVEVECVVALDHRLESCVVTREEPTGHGFGAAALATAKYFEVRPPMANGQPLDGGRIRFPVRFMMPAAPSRPGSFGEAGLAGLVRDRPTGPRPSRSVPAMAIVPAIFAVLVLGGLAYVMIWPFGLRRRRPGPWDVVAR